VLLTNHQLVITLNIYEITALQIPKALGLMATQRNQGKNFPASSFTRLLGTSSAKTFAPIDADLHRWAVLNVWPNYETAQTAAELDSLQRWEKISSASAVLLLTALSVKGSWGGRNPFAPNPPNPNPPHPTHPNPPNPNPTPAPRKWTGPTAALTRARIKPTRWLEFWRSSPPVARELAGSPGLLTAMGIGEAPIGLQGTFSLWQTNQDLTNFVQKGHAHRNAIDSATNRGWYAEDLFARLGVIAASGRIGSLNLSDLHLPSAG
jgi:hypothetical protein